jgi:hypothetical protein
MAETETPADVGRLGAGMAISSDRVDPGDGSRYIADAVRRISSC